MEKLIREIQELKARVKVLENRVSCEEQLIRMTENAIRDLRYDYSHDIVEYERMLRKYCKSIIVELDILEGNRIELEAHKQRLKKLRSNINHYYGDCYIPMDEADIILKIERDGFIPGTKV